MTTMIPAAKKRKPSEKQKAKGLGFTICEGVFSQCIEQVKSSLDVFYKQQSQMEPHKVMLGIYGVARSEAVTVVEFLADVQKSIMNPKHRLSTDITRTYLKVLEDINLVDKEDIEDPEFARFGAATVDFLTTLHIVLRDQTTYHLRNKTYKKYIEHYIDYAPADVQEKV